MKLIYENEMFLAGDRLKTSFCKLRQKFVLSGRGNRLFNKDHLMNDFVKIRIEISIVFVCVSDDSMKSKKFHKFFVISLFGVYNKSSGFLKAEV